MLKRFHCRKGNAMLEFALATGILLPAFVGTFQFGYTFYVYNNLDTAVRGGARYASMQSTQRQAPHRRRLRRRCRTWWCTAIRRELVTRLRRDWR